MRRSWFVALLALVVLAIGHARTAEACWDGHYAKAGPVTVANDNDRPWSPELVHEVAQTLTRLAAVLPQGMSVESHFGVVSFDCDARCTSLPAVLWDQRSYADLIRLVTDAVHGAKTAPTLPSWTVQVASFRSPALAEAYVEKISSEQTKGLLGERGFLRVGSFPSNNPIAHVVRATVSGVTVHQVVVHAFVDRKEAVAARDELATVLGRPAFVRGL